MGATLAIVDVDPPTRRWYSVIFEQEPLSADSPLLQLDNVVATPHMGSATHETLEAMARCAVDNLLAALAGERPANLVNPGAWRG